MASELELYRGREQSYIKHQFLTQYLQAAAYKTLQGRSPFFNFVDAFAGPWQVSDKNFSDASFDQALRILETVRADLGRSGITGLKIRFCFCERRADAVERLRQYAASHGRFEIQVFHGSFEDRLADIASICRDGFTFTFIDPTGWNIRSEPVFEFLKDLRGEFLLNFMAEHVNRHAEYSQVAESFGRFLADPEWSDEFSNLPSEWSNERRVLHLLREKIKATGAATFVPDFPILKPREERVKMRLLLGTHSAKGLEVFRDVQEKVEKQEIETRNQLRVEGQAQVSLFTDDEIAAMQQKAAGIGCSAFQREAEKRILDRLSAISALVFSDIATDILEYVPMRLTQIKKLLNNMKSRNVVSFDLPARKRVPQKNTEIFLVQEEFIR
ncbi:MAG: three-Cys-motif partner protein TcmP [Planctomycetaceae bacterium]|nr:three-Cys-motif partner protein TcmP [Planctomycetaceae bacterium]